MSTGPASAGLAEDIPARVRMMSAQGFGGVNNGAAASKGELLGLQSHLLPYWQPGVDPTEAWHAYEKQVRALYAKCAPLPVFLHVSNLRSCPPDFVLCCMRLSTLLTAMRGPY